MLLATCSQSAWTTLTNLLKAYREEVLQYVKLKLYI